MSCATQYNVYSYFFKKHLIYQKFSLVLSMFPVAAHGHITSSRKEGNRCWPGPTPPPGVRRPVGPDQVGGEEQPPNRCLRPCQCRRPAATPVAGTPPPALSQTAAQRFVLVRFPQFSCYWLGPDLPFQPRARGGAAVYSGRRRCGTIALAAGSTAATAVSA
jgi:hypothetical protein